MPRGARPDLPWVTQVGCTPRRREVPLSTAEVDDRRDHLAGRRSWSLSLGCIRPVVIRSTTPNAMPKTPSHTIHGGCGLVVGIPSSGGPQLSNIRQIKNMPNPTMTVIAVAIRRRSDTVQS